jgi:Spy/CpxP family protein refolding chaperone
MRVKDLRGHQPSRRVRLGCLARNHLETGLFSASCFFMSRTYSPHAAWSHWGQDEAEVIGVTKKQKGDRVMKKTAIRTVVVLTAVGLVATVVACSRPCARHRMNPEKAKKFVTWKVDDVLDDLEATDEQRQEIHAVKDKVFEDVRVLKEDLRGDRMTFLTEMKKDKPDSDLLHRKLDGHINRLRAFAHQELDNLLRAHASLTPEQRAQLLSKAEEHMHDR